MEASPSELLNTGRGAREGRYLGRTPFRLVIGFLVSWAFDASAAAPVLDQVFPFVVQAGTTNTLSFVGKFEPWPVEVWSSGSGLRWEATTNAGSFRVIVPADATLGPRLVRCFNTNGASSVRYLSIEREPQSLEVEPNDDFRKPQSVTSLPASLNGRLEKAGDVDSFAISVAAAETLVATLDGYLYQSPFDGVLRVLDDRGQQVAWNHDNGRTLDPQVAFTAPRAGTYVVQVFGFDHPAGSEVRFGGNAKCAYRLRLTTRPSARYSLPLGVQRGQRTSLVRYDWNGRTNGCPISEFDGGALAPRVREVFVSAGDGANPLRLTVGEGPELLEAETGGTVPEGGRIPVPGALSGAIGKRGDEDRFVFSARPGEALHFAIEALELGFPLQAWVRVDDAKGKTLARSPDGALGDPHLDWTAPSEGDFAVVVGSLLHRGGPDHLYRLSIQSPRPDFEAQLAADAFVLEAGKTNEVKVNVRRLGVTAKLVVEVDGLPAGVMASSADAPDRDGEVVLSLVAAADATVWNGPIQVRVRERYSGRSRWAQFPMATTGENNGVPQGYRHLVIEAHEQPWLTVVPAAKAPEKPTPPSP